MVKVKNYIELVTGEQMYVQEGKKLSIKDSLLGVEGVIKDILAVYISVVYGVLAKYLIRNTLKYSKYYWEKLGISSLSYTMSHAEFVNKYFSIEDSGYLFRNVGIQLVDVASYRLTEVDKILDGLAKVTKE